MAGVSNRRGANMTLVSLIMEMFEEDSSSDEELEFLVHAAEMSQVEEEKDAPVKKKPSVEGYVDTVLQRYSPDDFKTYFRVNRSTFDYVLNIISQSVVNNSIEGRGTICPQKQLLVAIWTLVTPESYRFICDRFDIGRATAIRTLERVSRALCDLAPTYITWPTADRATEVMEGFQVSGQFIQAIGAVDALHIEIPTPKTDPDSYLNSKGEHTILLQGVCDHNAMFTHVDVGNPGSVSNLWMFRLSEVARYLEDPATYFPKDSHLLGDRAYTIHPHLMVPYRDDGHLAPRESNFNYRLLSTRSAIWRAFGMLKGRFRKLKYLPMTKVELMPQVIVACCVLHNICLGRGDVVDEEFGERTAGHFEEQEIRTYESSVGEAKRSSITEVLPLGNYTLVQPP